MPPSAIKTAIRRAFWCWPSRIGAASLVALAVSCGADFVSTPTDAGNVSASLDTLWAKTR